MNYDVVKLTCGAAATVGLYSILYRENKLYRLFEHIFVGLAVGYAVVALWRETLYDTWWGKMVGSHIDPVYGGSVSSGYWAYILLLPIGLMGYFVFSKKHNWISRIPIGIIIGLYAGQQIQVWWTRYGPQVYDSLRPVLPTTTDRFTVPDKSNLSPADLTRISNEVFPSQALSNLVFVVTVVTVLSYFLFSFDLKNKLLKGMSTTGRLLLMVGFGAIFGSTVMMRFTLLIDRMYFIWVEWLKLGPHN